MSKYIIKNINRISIVGGPGTGKTTLAKNLGKILNLPVYHLDAIRHLKNWKLRDKEERNKIILDITKNSKWIMDGTYCSTLETRIINSDIVIFLNYSKLARLKGIFTRYLKNINKEIPEIPGCIERINMEFLKTTLIWNENKGITVNNILQKYSNKTILVFKNRTELNTWYEKEFKKKIEL